MERILLTVSVITAIAGILAFLLSMANRTIADYGEKNIRINDTRDLVVEGGGTLLSSLMEHEIFIPSACGGKGSCGYCKVHVISGGGQFLPTERGYITPQEASEGVRLSCQCKVKEDMSIQIPEELFNVKQYDYTVEKIIPVTEKIRHVFLGLPPGKEINFKPGQFIQIQTPLYEDIEEEVYRAYSIASSPSSTHTVELFIGYVPEGICTTYIHQYLKEGDVLTMAGPFGDFQYHDTGREMVMACIGTGLAPIMSILRYMRENSIHRKVTLFLSARTRKDLYMVDELEDIKKDLPDFKLVCSLTRPTPECHWEGEVGRVPDLLGKYVENAAEAEAYLCGNNDMIDSVVTALKSKGMPDTRIYYDKFM